MEMMSNYFENLEKAIKDIPPENIANYDETNFTDNPGSRKLIFRRGKIADLLNSYNFRRKLSNLFTGVKYPENVVANSKSSTSVMFCGTAAGLLLPIYVVYKAMNVYDTWIENGPPGARYNATSHGWFESATFQDWFRTIYIPHARTLIGPKVIIGDNLSSHISEEVINLAQKENVLFICLPANCTHIAQPLDVTFFGPLKRVWRNILLKFKMSNPTERVVPKDVFPSLMNELWQSIFAEGKAEANLKAGFRTCGIFPLDKDQVLKKMDKKVIPGIAVDDGKVLSDAVLEYMKMLREPQPLQRRGRKKKISTAPGQSICIEHFIHNEPIQKKRKVTAKAIRKNVRKTPIRRKIVSRATTKTASPKVRKKLAPTVVSAGRKKAKVLTVRKDVLSQDLVSSATVKVESSTIRASSQKLASSVAASSKKLESSAAAIKAKSVTVRKAIPLQQLMPSTESAKGSGKSVRTRSSSRKLMDQ